MINFPPAAAEPPSYQLFSDIVLEQVSFGGNQSLVLPFSSKEAAEASSEQIKQLLDTEDTSIIYKDENCFYLTQAQWNNLRQKLRGHEQAVLPKKDFIFKSLRGDACCFIDNFIKGVHGNRDNALRQRSQKLFTVTGHGVFQRRPTITDIEMQAPLKKPQYTAEKKAGYSKAQSASLGMADCYSPIFGWNTDKASKLVGAIFFDVEKSALLTDKNFSHDSGTVVRPFDFSTKSGAEKYFKDMKEKCLYAASEFEYFRQVLKRNNADVHLQFYSEMLVRLRWRTESSQFFIASDTLSARLLAQEYARRMKAYLLKNGLCAPDYVVPICFYMPQNPALNFKRYTSVEQKMDRIAARCVYADLTERKKFYQEENFEFLLSLLFAEVKEFFTMHADDLISLLEKGYIHVLAGILDKTTENEKHELLELLKNVVGKIKNENHIKNIIAKCLHIGNQDLANFFMQHKAIRLSISNAQYHNMHQEIVEQGNEAFLDSFIAEMMSAKPSDDSVQNVFNNMLWHAAFHNRPMVIRKLLFIKGVDVNFMLKQEVNGGALCFDRPLIIATACGNTEAVQALLESPNILIDYQVAEYSSIFSNSDDGSYPLYRSSIHDTPVDLAFSSAHIDIIWLLFDTFLQRLERQQFSSPELFKSEFHHNGYSFCRMISSCSKQNLAKFQLIFSKKLNKVIEEYNTFVQKQFLFWKIGPQKKVQTLCQLRDLLMRPDPSSKEQIPVLTAQYREEDHHMYFYLAEALVKNPHYYAPLENSQQDLAQVPRLE